MPSASQQIAIHLLDIKAVKFQPDTPFTWSSGWKSPIYCDNRLTLSYPHIRDFIRDAFVHRIRTTFPDVQAIVGVATGGIAHAALIAQELDLPLAYVRSKPKEHGLGNQIEGHLESGQKVVIVEDLISTGASALNAALAVRASEAEVLGLAAIFTYGFPEAKARFEAEQIPFFTLSDYHTLLQIALERGFINEEQFQLLEQWQYSPQTWSVS